MRRSLLGLAILGVSAQAFAQESPTESLPPIPGSPVEESAPPALPPPALIDPVPPQREFPLPPTPRLWSDEVPVPEIPLAEDDNAARRAVWQPWYSRPRRVRPRSWFFQLEGGVAYQRIYGLSLWGGEASMMADHEWDWGAIKIGGAFMDGSLSGLNLAHVALRTELEGRAGLVRIGGGVGLGVLGISTVSTVDSSPSACSTDASLHVTVDVDRLDERGKRALYVGAKLLGTLVLSNRYEPVVWGPLLLAGIRL